MPAYFIVGASIPTGPDGCCDRGDYDEYIAKVKPVVEAKGGKYLVRSEKITAVAGGWRPDRVIVIEFASLKHLEACFSSPEYKSIAGLRIGSVHADALIVEG